MDSSARSSAPRLYTVIALTVFAFFSFLFIWPEHSGSETFVHYDRRDVLVPRQSRTSATGTSSSTSSSISLELTSPSATASSVSSSTSISSTPSLVVSTTPTTTTSSSTPVSSSFSGLPLTRSASSTPSSSSNTPVSSASSISTEKSATSSQSILRYTGSVGRTPATTLALTNIFLPTFTPPVSQPTSSSPAIPSVTAVSAAVVNSSFWHKKGAVAAIFVIVALVILAIAAILIVTFLKRRSAHREARLHEALFEKYSEPERRSPSPSASINGVPMDPFATREVGYDAPPRFPSYTTPQHPITYSTSPVQHPDFYSQPPSRYLAPSQAQAARNPAPPSAFRSPDARDSYQHSIDSFYGAGQPSGF